MFLTAVGKYDLIEHTVKPGISLVDYNIVIRYEGIFTLFLRLLGYSTVVKLTYLSC